MDEDDFLLPVSWSTNDSIVNNLILENRPKHLRTYRDIVYGKEVDVNVYEGMKDAESIRQANPA